MIEIKALDVNNKTDKEKFIRFAWKIYQGDTNWVPPLLMDMRAKLNKKHPFFEFGEVKLYMAYKNGEEVGRIAAIRNPLYNDFHKCKTGFWGFFESINDQNVANVLFDTAKKQLQTWGLNIMHGPASPSSNYDYGLLVEGFDDPPRIMMTYNPAYYVDLVTNYGFEKVMGLLAYKVAQEDVYKNEKMKRVVEIAKERYKLKIRTLDMKNLKNEVPIVKKIYNKAWENNYGFVPMTDAEINAIAAELKMGADPAIMPMIENEKGEVIAMSIVLPDFNLLFKEMNGRLFPFNFLKLLFRKKEAFRWVRILLLGVLPEYRGKGIDAVLYDAITQAAKKKGNLYGEGSWILENNEPMNRGMRVLGGEVYKKYNVYEVKI